MNTNVKKPGPILGPTEKDLGPKVEIRQEADIVPEENVAEAPKATFESPLQKQKENPSPIQFNNVGNGASRVQLQSEYSKLIKKPEFAAIELSANKRDLINYVNNSVSLISETQYTNASIQDFNYFLSNNNVGKFGNQLEAEEASQLLKLYYPSSKDNKQSISGVFEILLNREDLLPKNSGDDLLELSTLEDVSGLFKNSKMAKFTLDGYRNLYSVNTGTNKVHVFLPAVLILIAYFGLEPKEIIRDYFVSVAETTNTLTIRIRK